MFYYVLTIVVNCCVLTKFYNYISVTVSGSAESKPNNQRNTRNTHVVNVPYIGLFMYFLYDQFFYSTFSSNLYLYCLIMLFYLRKSAVAKTFDTAQIVTFTEFDSLVEISYQYTIIVDHRSCQINGGYHCSRCKYVCMCECFRYKCCKTPHLFVLVLNW